MNRSKGAAGGALKRAAFLEDFDRIPEELKV
jgi:hypothetical protein